MCARASVEAAISHSSRATWSLQVADLGRQEQGAPAHLISRAVEVDCGKAQTSQRRGGCEFEFQVWVLGKLSEAASANATKGGPAADPEASNMSGRGKG
eukprot:2137338-Rhodomonas_salina.1